MKLISIETARSLWLFTPNDMNPRGKHIAKSIMTHLNDEYKFTQYPKTPEEMDPTKGINFLNGQFNPISGDPVEISFKAFNFGVVAETRSSTRDTDAFLDQILGWISQEHDLPSIDQVLRSKAYVSEVYVHSDKTLDFINPKLKSIIQRLNRNVKGHGSLSYQVCAIAFGSDPAINQSFPFKLERAESVAFSENRYYSIAALETETHLEILNDLEAIL